MIDPVLDISLPLRAAVVALLGAAGESTDLVVHRSEHADYQADVALALARQLKRPPKEVAAAIVERLPPSETLSDAKVSGPGFINLNCRREYLAMQLERMQSDSRLGIETTLCPDTVVVDFSSPNLAKEMHVGHLRSTILGDSLARILACLGHTVIRQNHLGDWGTPFGMLIEHMLDEGAAGGAGGAGGAEATAGSNVRELSAFYRSARLKFDSDSQFADRARRRVVLLQGGDPSTLEHWRRLIEITTSHIDALYKQLHVALSREDIAGESHYNPHLESLVAELEHLGLATSSDGAVCVFPPGFLSRDGQPLPLIIRKQDGGFGYAATDLAALKYRLQTLAAHRVLYVVGAPQSQHFAMVFATAQQAEWVPEGARLEHVAFGSVLGQDGKELKSRAGGAVSLSALLDEAILRARAIVDEGSPSLAEGERARTAEIVGIGAVKYADLASDRIKDYVFNWSRMLAFEGNTAPYLMYAHARIRSILRKAGAHPAAQTSDRAAIRIDAPMERALALELLQFPGTLARVAETLQPHRLCQQLFRTATAFSGFYDACPVLSAEPTVRSSRLALCDLMARVLARGLELLGIEAPESM